MDVDKWLQTTTAKDTLSSQDKSSLRESMLFLVLKKAFYLYGFFVLIAL